MEEKYLKKYNSAKSTSVEHIAIEVLLLCIGNFTVAEISEEKFRLLPDEWMQLAGCEKYGSDNAIWIAKSNLNKREKLAKGLTGAVFCGKTAL